MLYSTAAGVVSICYLNTFGETPCVYNSLGRRESNALGDHRFVIATPSALSPICIVRSLGCMCSHGRRALPIQSREERIQTHLSARRSATEAEGRKQVGMEQPQRAKKNRHETNRFIYRKHRRVSVWIKTSRRTYSAPQLKVRIIFIPAAFIVDNSIRFLSLLWENVIFGELKQEEERKRKGLMIAGCAEVVTKPRGQQLTKM